MSRPRPEDRLEVIAEAALEAFIEHGFRHTKMTDVARRAKVAPGTLYLYVPSKEALFLLALRHSDGERLVDEAETLPLTVSDLEPALVHVREALQRNLEAQAIMTVELDIPPSSPEATRLELERVIGQLFDSLFALRRAVKLIDRCAVDAPELAQLWHTRTIEIVARLARYLASRAAQARLRSTPDPAATARLIIESCAFFAMHRHWDRRRQPITDADARATVVELLCAALVLG